MYDSYPYFDPMNVKKSWKRLTFTWISNHEDEIANIIQEVQQREILYFAFETTSHDSVVQSYTHQQP